MPHLASNELGELFASLRFAAQGCPEQHDGNECTAFRLLRPIFFSPNLGMPYQFLVAAVDAGILTVRAEIEAVVAQNFTAVISRIAAPITHHRQEYQSAADLDDLLIGYGREQSAIVIDELGEVPSEPGCLFRYFMGVQYS